MRPYMTFPFPSRNVHVDLWEIYISIKEATKSWIEEPVNDELDRNFSFMARIEERNKIAR